MTESNKTLLSVKQLSEATGLSVSTLYKSVNAGKLPCLRLGRRILFDLDLVCRHLGRLATVHVEEAATKNE